MTGDQARPAIRNFAFHEDLVRVVPLEGRPWFVAPDVCRVLDLKNVTRSLGRLPKHAVALHSVKGDGGDRRVNIVSEGGLYRLVFTSRVPKAEEIDKPCKECGGLGFKNRIGLFELLVVDDKIREILIKQPKLDLLTKAARLAGMRPLQEEGLLLVAKGITSLPELQRVLKE